MRIPNNQEWQVEEKAIRHTDQQEPADPKEVLSQLVELLEDYGPSWYTEEHHNRALAALGIHHES